MTGEAENASGALPGADRERPGLDPSPEEMRRLGYAVVDRLVQHLATLSEQRIVRPGTAAEHAARVDEPLPEKGRGVEDSLDFFFERVVPGMTKVNHPRFHAYIPCPSSFYGLLGELLSAGTNPFVGSWLGGGALCSLELTVLRWIAEAVGYNPESSGILTSGGSMANLIALAAARHRAGRSTLDNGTLYFSTQGHASAEKAALTLGYGEESLRRVPVDGRFRMSLQALESMIEEDRQGGRQPFLVCANAGTTNTGSIDPLPSLAELCRRQQLWFHVDAAYGGFAALCPAGRELLAGMEEADSLTLDPHKWLYSPMGTGCVLVQDRSSLEGAFAAAGDYLRDIPPHEVNFFNRGPELSRPGRALSVWMLLRCAGLDAVAEQVACDMDLARLAESLLAASSELEIVCPAELSIVTFRCKGRNGEDESRRQARDAALAERLIEAGRVMISSTLLEGSIALRLVVQNHRTSESELRRSVELICSTAEEIAAQSP